jgi:hypothetical protein
MLIPSSATGGLLMASRVRDLCLGLCVCLWTIALVPSWSRSAAGTAVTDRFCVGWPNSPLIESVEVADPGSDVTPPSFSARVNVNVLSWSVLAFAVGAVALKWWERLTRAARTAEPGAAADGGGR